jgi:excisionase family DNA binding protein
MKAGSMLLPPAGPTNGSVAQVVVPALLTVDAAASALTVSTVTVRTWMRQRRLTKVKLGRRVAVTAESVAALIQGGLE